jgi:AcrR family transcriptional regulator
MTHRNRDAYHHGQLREVLLQAALERLDAHGVDAVTIRAVARDAGVSHAAPANHFADRRQLLTALAVNCFLDLDRRIVAALDASDGDQRDRAALLAECVIDYGLTYPWRYRLLWRWDLLDQTNPAFVEAMEAIYDKLLKTVSDAGQPGTLSRETYGIALWSIVHGYVSLRLEGLFVAAADEASGIPRHRAIIDALLKARA